MEAEDLQYQHLYELLATLRAIPDPEDRVRAIEASLGRVLTTQNALADLRREAVREMLNTMNKSEVGRRLGISNQRVGQLAGTGIRYPGRHKRVATKETT